MLFQGMTQGFQGCVYGFPARQHHDIHTAQTMLPHSEIFPDSPFDRVPVHGLFNLFLGDCQTQPGMIQVIPDG